MRTSYVTRAREEDVARIFPPAIVEALRRAAETPVRTRRRSGNDTVTERVLAVNEVIRRLHLHHPQYFRPEALYPASHNTERKQP